MVSQDGIDEAPGRNPGWISSRIGFLTSKNMGVFGHVEKNPRFYFLWFTKRWHFGVITTDKPLSDYFRLQTMDVAAAKTMSEALYDFTIEHPLDRWQQSLRLRT